MVKCLCYFSAPSARSFCLFVVFDASTQCMLVCVCAHILHILHTLSLRIFAMHTRHYLYDLNFNTCNLAAWARTHTCHGLRGCCHRHRHRHRCLNTVCPQRTTFTFSLDLDMRGAWIMRLMHFLPHHHIRRISHVRFFIWKCRHKTKHTWHTHTQT